MLWQQFIVIGRGKKEVGSIAGGKGGWHFDVFVDFAAGMMLLWPPKSVQVVANICWMRHSSRPQCCNAKAMCAKHVCQAMPKPCVPCVVVVLRKGESPCREPRAVFARSLLLYIHCREFGLSLPGHGLALLALQSLR